ncbi:MAG: hypothetical protein R3D98_14450 [Candidatus Krumholzibacteriia bacterium]
MAGDGVSLQTNLAQMGNLAKAQARNPGSTQGPSVAQELQKQDVTSVEKVREIEKAEQDAVDPDQERERERRRRQRPKAGADDADEPDDEENAERAQGLGGLIDIKA